MRCDASAIHLRQRSAREFKRRGIVPSVSRAAETRTNQLERSVPVIDAISAWFESRSTCGLKDRERS